jgi:hypothetical protein
VPHVLGEPARGHLGGELDALGGKARAQGALDLEVAGGVDVKSQVAEEREMPRLGLAFIAAAHGEAERSREGEACRAAVSSAA